MPIDYAAARSLLEQALAEVEAAMLQGAEPACAEGIREAVDRIFQSGTQAYREVLVGCILARIQDRRINIRLPYVGQGPHSYNGRTLDERVVNPFLHDHRIPSSRGPFLSAFRRSVRFDSTTRSGLRDTHGIEDYLFLTRLAGVSSEAKTQAHQYFSQGHEVNFLEIRDWILMCLATMGRRGREIFNRSLVRLVDSAEMPRSIKVAWNEQISHLTSPTQPSG